MENPSIATLRKVQAQVRQSGVSVTTTSLEDYDLGGVDCPICQNRGYLMYTKDGYDFSRECDCMAKRRSMRRIRKSGMEDMLARYTFDAYETPDKSRENIKAAAERFCDADTGWFYISGRSGSGKTHICTAVCSRLIERGKETYYMRWRDESRKLKALVNSDEIEEPLEMLKRVPVLYIDDFFKGGHTEADERIAFEILNSRYNDTKLRTIFSTELGIEDVLDIDEALGGRIKERSRGFLITAPQENWRLR